MKNPFIENFVTNCGHKLAHLYILNDCLYRYQNIVILGTGSDEIPIYMTALQFNLRISAFCNVFEREFDFLNKDMDYIPTLTPDEVQGLPDCALLCAGKKLEKLKECHGSLISDMDIYIADVDFHDHTLNGKAVPSIWRLNPAILEKPIVIFGTGAQGKAQAKTFEEHGTDFQAFSVNNPAKHGTCMMDREVISPDKLKTMIGTVNVVCAIQEWQPVYRQLRLMGFAEGNIFLNTVRFCHVGGSVVGFFRNGYFKMAGYANIAMQYRHGKMIYDSLKQLNTDYVVFPQSAVGDLTLTLPLIAEYKKEHKIGRIKCVVAEEREDLAPWLIDVTDCLFLPQSKIIDLWDYLYLIGEDRKFTIAFFKRLSWLRDAWIRSGPEEESLMEEYQHILGVNPVNIPHITVKMKKLPEISDNSIMLLTGISSYELMGKYNRKKWDKLLSNLAKKLDSKGFSVYTNIKNEDDEAIDGTRPHQSTVSEMLETVNNFKCIISVPTGLGELLALTQCNMISIFPVMLDSHRLALDQLADRENAVSVSWQLGQEEETIDEVVRLVESY